MDADQLVEASCAQAGSSDFGTDSFREGLERFVDALDREAALTEVGTLAMEAQISGNLVNRLRVTDWISSHPEVVEERVESPTFVLGLPRTGTTLMSYLLDCDPARRSLMRWEATNSIPPPEAATFTTDAAHRGSAHRRRDARCPQPGVQGHPLRGARRAHRVRDVARPGLQESAALDRRLRALLRRVAPRVRPVSRLRVPPSGATGPAVAPRPARGR